MRRLLSTYILKEIFVPFILSTVILTVTVLLGKVLKLVELIVTHGIGPATIVSFIISIVPTFLIYILPISFLVAVLIACTRLSSDNEIIAMKSSGISLYALLKPVLLFAFGVYLLTLFVSLYAYPWGNFNVKKTLFEVARTNTVSAIEEKTFYSRFEGVVLYVDNIPTGGGLMQGIFISQTDDKGKTPSSSLARDYLSPQQKTSLSRSYLKTAPFTALPARKRATTIWRTSKSTPLGWT